ncbi:MAG: glycosyltransferase [Xenococcaceae cyanobacterium MO_188.B19]|nr:glycosyltransferase [Xenococcaceae cyanobacterium MO_188.B19]
MLVGVSIIICCHNSASRLPQTLAHLAAQQVQENIGWEVIVVNNASTDKTAQVASEFWPKETPVPLRVIHEPKLGLSNARHRGLIEAKYEVISFVDDDNWVCPEWVELVSEIMNQHPEVGACGGQSEAVCEITPPYWFERYQGDYAVGVQADIAGYVPSKRGYLWGAGLSIRKSALMSLINQGFQPLNMGRQGKSQGAGDDSELCYALGLAGWHLWYEPRLKLCHFLPAGRLQWNYLRRLHRGFGASKIGHEPYHLALKPSPETFKEKLKQTWYWQSLSLLKKILRCPGKLLLLFSLQEGNHEVIILEYLIGNLQELLRRRNAYNIAIQHIRDVPWRTSKKLDHA